MFQVTQEPPRLQYTAAAGAGQTFPFTFWLSSPADMAVFVGSDKLEDSDYTVTLAPQGQGGQVVVHSTLTAGSLITLKREMEMVRTTAFQSGGMFKASALNLELSKLVAMVQEVAHATGRALKLSDISGINPANLTLPAPAAGRALIWDGDEGKLTNGPNAADIAAAQDNAAIATTAASSASQAATSAQDAMLDAQSAVGSVRASGADTTAAPLMDKLTTDASLNSQLVSDNGSEQLEMGVAASGILGSHLSTNALSLVAATANQVAAETFDEVQVASADNALVFALDGDDVSFHFLGIRPDSTDAPFIAQVSTDGGQTWDTAANYSGVLSFDTHQTAAVDVNSTNQLHLSAVTSSGWYIQASGAGYFGQLKVYNATQTAGTAFDLVSSNHAISSTAGWAYKYAGGGLAYQIAQALTHIRFIFANNQVPFSGRIIKKKGRIQ